VAPRLLGTQSRWVFKGCWGSVQKTVQAGKQHTPRIVNRRVFGGIRLKKGNCLHRRQTTPTPDPDRAAATHQFLVDLRAVTRPRTASTTKVGGCSKRREGPRQKREMTAGVHRPGWRKTSNARLKMRMPSVNWANGLKGGYKGGRTAPRAKRNKINVRSGRKHMGTGLREPSKGRASFN